MNFLSVFLLLFLCCADIIYAEVRLNFLPQSYCKELITDPFSPQSFIKFLDVKRIDARIGEDIGIIGLSDIVSLKSSAFINIVLYPHNYIFKVDRFHAGLSIGLCGKIKEIYWMVLPLYHESAHLADGYNGDVKSDSEVISRESLKFGFIFKKNDFKISFKLDWFWHSVRPVYRWSSGVGMEYEKPFIIKEESFSLGPVFSFFAYLLERKRLSFNYELFCGLFISNKRIFRIGFTLEDREGLGQDYKTRSKTQGLMINILFN